MDLKEKLKDFLEKFKNQSNKDKMLQLVFVIIIGLTLVILNGILKNNTEVPHDSQQQNIVIESTQSQLDIEDRLKNILSKIDGVGSVDVLVTFETKEQSEIAYNKTTSSSVTTEEDSQGGERVVQQNNYDENAVMVNSGNGNSPFILFEKTPEIKGVMIVADGAENPQIKYELMKGVQFLLDIPAHKVIVYPRKKY